MQLWPLFALATFLVWIIVVATTRIVSLATVLAAIAFPLCVFGAAAFGRPQPLPLQIFALAIAALILFTHRTNLQRLRRGEEPRLGLGTR